MPKEDLLTASRLCDYRVHTHSGELLGYVVDVVLELVSGTVTHVVVRPDQGLLGQADLRLVPLAAVVPAYNEQLLTLQAANQRLEAFATVPFDLQHRGLLAGAPSGAGASGSFR